jgi:NAD(P)H-quinone oxidoreductase subunit 5
MTCPFITINHFGTKRIFSYPQESDNTILFPMLVLVLFTLFIGAIGIPFNQFNQEEMNLDILSKLLIPTLSLLHQNQNESVDWYEFVTNSTFSVSIAYLGIFIASSLYKPIYSSLQNLKFLNLVAKKGPKRILWDKIINVIYDWSYNRGYIDVFYAISLTEGIRRLAELTSFFDRRVIDGITNGVGFTSFFAGEGIKYVGGGRISFYLLLYLFYVLIFLLISSSIFSSFSFL